MDMPQRVRHLSQSTALGWSYVQEVLADIIAETVLIQQIPAPTFHELVRANHVLSRLGACDLVGVGIDGVNNAYGRLPGSDPDAPALLVCAHTDTVFRADTDLTLRREEGGRICGPGIGDNSAGIAAMIALADILRQFRARPRRDIWFVATSREEGLGDLGGIRAFYERRRARLGLAINVEGMAFGRVYHAGIAARRLHVVCRADGGHSWHQFGQPSAIHGLVRAAARLTELTPPTRPRTTYNIGLIEGGHSINSLATEASFYLDLRSEDPAALAALEREVMALIAAAGDEGLRFSVEVVGDRPAGAIPPEHELVQAAIAALETVGVKPITQAGSTDANFLLAQGVPTVTIGVVRGGNAHRPDEYIETATLADGMKQLILLALAAAEWTPA